MMLRAALAALLLCGCVEDRIVWWVPPDATDEEAASAGEACERWNYVAIRQQYITRDEFESTDHIELRLRPHMLTANVDGEEGLDIGVHILRGMAPPSVTAVLTHEMGHHLGLRHIAAVAAGVMNANGCRTAEHGVCDFSLADLAECRRVNACR